MCSANLVHRAVHGEKMTDRKNQLIRALEYCEQNSCRGNKALNTGLFPLVKSLLIMNRILDGTSNHLLYAKEYCSVLTFEKETLLAEYLVSTARAYQPFNQHNATKYALAMLTLRQKINRSCH